MVKGQGKQKRKNSVDELPPDIQTEEEKLRGLLTQKQRAEKELIDLEQKIYNLERNYIEETQATGNLIKGFNDFLKRSSEKSSDKKKGAGQSNFINSDLRIFSNSSATYTKSLQISVKEEEEHYIRVSNGLSSPNTPLTGPKKIRRKRKQIQDSDDDESVRNFSNIDDDEDPNHLEI